MRARTVGLVAALVLAGGGAYVANRLASGGDVTEVGIDRAVERFRSSESSAPASSTTTARTTTTADGVPLALPAAGVYSYATSGHDAVDALTGARHDYPDTTTVTVTRTACGVRLRWDVAAERWDSWDWCAEDGGIRVAGWSGFHQFFGVGARNDYVCTGDLRPLDAEPGTTWDLVCRAGDRDTSSYLATVVARTSVSIGGAAVPALHVRYDVTVDGVSVGAQTVEEWYRTADGLLLRRVVTTDTRQQTAIGETAFEERATIELRSVDPRR
jgi:hypothetical protein